MGAVRPSDSQEYVVSLGIVIKGPEGLVLAADSRLTLVANRPDGTVVPVSFDNATKVLAFQNPHQFVGAVTYGAAAIRERTAYGLLPEFEDALPKQRLSVEDFAQQVGKFFGERWREAMPSDYKGPDMTFVVGGFDEGAPYGRCFLVDIPRSPAPSEQSPDQQFGMTWGGQNDLVARLVLGFDPRALDILSRALDLAPERIRDLGETLKKELALQLPFAAMPLQDCVNLAIHFIRTTAGVLDLTVQVRGVGGAIEVATITRRDGFRFVQHREIVGEARAERG